MSKYHFAENIKRLRLFSGYSQQDISDKLQISRQAYSNYERGTRLPDVKTAIELADFYHVSLDTIIKSTDPTGIFQNQNLHTSFASTPLNLHIPIDEATTKFLSLYLLLPQDVQKEIRDFTEFKKRFCNTD